MGAGLRWRLSASLPTLSGGGSGAAGVWVLGKRRTGSEGNGLPGAPRRSDDATKNFADVGQGVKKEEEEEEGEGAQAGLQEGSSDRKSRHVPEV